MALTSKHLIAGNWVGNAEAFESTLAHGPVNLTLKENIEFLERHAREFASKTAFSWIVRPESGRYIECA